MSEQLYINFDEYIRQGEPAQRERADAWRANYRNVVKGVETTAEDTISLVKKMGRLMSEYKAIIRPNFGSKYNHELLNGLFYHPYTKIEYVVTNMQISRQTASKYLERIVSLGLLQKEKMGKENYYINTRLMNLFIDFGKLEPAEPHIGIESVYDKELPKD